MKLLAVVVIVFASYAFAQDKNPPFLGTWEGESKCTVPDSPCHDEHVVYEIKAAKAGPVIEMYKIVNGEQQYMGSVECGAPKDDVISCQIPNKGRVNDWVFQLNGDSMSGTLYIDKERRVYRKINAKKK